MGSRKPALILSQLRRTRREGVGAARPSGASPRLDQLSNAWGGGFEALNRLIAGSRASHRLPDTAALSGGEGFWRSWRLRNASSRPRARDPPIGDATGRPDQRRRAEQLTAASPSGWRAGTFRACLRI